MTKQEMHARIKELRLSFNHCGLCDTFAKCAGMGMCALGEVSEEEEYLSLKLKGCMCDFAEQET